MHQQFAIAATGTILTFFIPWLLKRVRSFRNFGWLYGISGLVLLILVLFSGKVFGANLVLSLGPVSVQPGEFVKILYVLFVASMFNKSITFKQTVLVTVLAAAHVLVLVASNDLGAGTDLFCSVSADAVYRQPKRSAICLRDWVQAVWRQYLLIISFPMSKTA